MKAIERVLIYLKHKKLNKSSFEKKVNLSNGYIATQSKRDADLGEGVLIKILDNCLDLNPEWLLTGSGEMLRQESKDYKIIEGSTDKVEDDKVDYSNKDYVPFYPVDFIGGNIESVNDQTIKPDYYMLMPQFRGCVSFYSYNDSMEPLITSGMILFAKEIIDWKSHIEFGQIYGIVANDGRKYLKYIRRHKTKNETHFILKSENEECYDEFDFSHKEIRSIWLIHGWITQRISV